MRPTLLAATLVALLSTTTRAELTVPHFFSDHMVLQRDRTASIWGTADAGARVNVGFRGESIAVAADADGNWNAEMLTGDATGVGSDLTITTEKTSVVIRDVVVGEVWLASGQSNMVFTMNRVPGYADTIANADYPGIRMFNAPTVTAVEPQDDIEGEWTLCSPESTAGYSAVAFFFARKLHTELNIPIGVIKTAWGGKPVETFTSREALNTLDGTRKLVEAVVAADKSFDPAKAASDFESRLQQWQTQDAAWRSQPEDARGRRPRRPSKPKRPLDTEGRPGVLFNAMIHPFVGYTLRGAIWYQGEGNAKPGAVPYDQTLPLMINDWRDRWGIPMSFYFVQLANFRSPSTEPGNNDPWPLLQDRMRRVLDSTPDTGMAIINDVGEANDIHPKNKHDVGERLALWALAKNYERDITYSGPLFQDYAIDDSVASITFDQVGRGLRSRDGAPLQRFEIAGNDKVWHWADAEIINPTTVSVSSHNVPHPAAVRYAWAANPDGANLVNSEGLPASVFRTDDWDDVEPFVDLQAQKRLEQRRSLAAKIKGIAAEKAKLQRGSDAFKATLAKQRELLKQLQSLAPQPAE
ncbi:MAG: sialate O-acetylesterase [Planctomycetota bacterium]